MTDPTEALLHVARGGDDFFGRYEVSNFERWNLFAPRAGNVLTTELPGEWFGQDGIEGVFVVTDRELQADGSMLVYVRAVGASRDDALPALSSSFNRRAGALHICLGEGPCSAEGAVFHVRSLELWDGPTFPGHRLSVGGRRMLKQVLAGAEVADGAEWEEGPAVDLGDSSKKGLIAEPEKKRKRDTGTGKGGRPPVRPKPKKKQDGDGGDFPPTAPGILRDRLEKIRARQETMGRGATPERDGEDLEKGEAGSAAHAVERLTTSRKLGETSIVAGRGVQRPGNGQAERRGGTMKSLTDKPRTAGVTSSLVLRAAEACKRSKSGKKKKKKKEKAFDALRTIFGGKKKKKKKKKKKGGSEDPDGGSGGGSSGGSGDSSEDGGSSDSSGGKESSDEASLLPPLKKKSDRQEGSVLELLVEQVEMRLNELSGSGEHSNALMQGTKIVTYWHSLTQGGGVSQQTRDGRELFLIANCIDLLRVGRLGRLGDALAARWFALEQAQLDQGWSAAKHLELYSPEHLTAAGPAITLAARKYSKLMDKVAATDEKKTKSWGKGRKGQNAGGWQPADAWQAKGGKGKGGKHQKDDQWGKWQQDGRGSWKKQNWPGNWKKAHQQEDKEKADAPKGKNDSA